MRFVGVLVFLAISSQAFAVDKFAGKRADCQSAMGKEIWQFVGLTKEYTKKLFIGKTAQVEQAGKYSVKGETLTVSEFKSDSKEIDPKRIFPLRFAFTETGFEYMWKTPAGKELPYSCQWVKN